MKPYLKTLSIVALVLAASSAYANTSEAIDYNQGYCVPYGEAIEVDNAIVVVEGQKILGSYIMLRPNHRFFDPTLKVELEAANWGGNLSLVKTGEVSGEIFNAVYENHTHYNDIPKQLVHCVAKTNI